MNAAEGFPLAFVQASGEMGRYDDTDERAPDIAKLAGLLPGSSVLDLPCGVGRYAAALHRLGYDVTGADLSKEQIDYAKQHNAGPNYCVADMRYPPGGTFDLIINLYSSFGYFDSVDEDRKLLSTWRSSLRPGGALIMELSDTERAIHRLGKTEGVIVREYERCREYLQMNWTTRILTTSYDLLDGRPAFTCRARLYAKEELAEMLATAGYRNVAVYGSFSGRLKEPADRAILVAQRPEK